MHWRMERNWQKVRRALHPLTFSTTVETRWQQPQEVIIRIATADGVIELRDKVRGFPSEKLLTQIALLVG